MPVLGSGRDLEERSYMVGGLPCFFSSQEVSSFAFKTPTSKITPHTPSNKMSKKILMQGGCVENPAPYHGVELSRTETKETICSP